MLNANDQIWMAELISKITMKMDWVSEKSRQQNSVYDD